MLDVDKVTAVILNNQTMKILLLYFISSNSLFCSLGSSAVNQNSEKQIQKTNTKIVQKATKKLAKELNVRFFLSF